MQNRRDFLKWTTLIGGMGMLGTDMSISTPESSAAPTPDPETYNVKMSLHVRKTPLPPRKIEIPNVDKYQVLKGDFHIHTLFSDGRVMPRDRVEEAVDNGLDVIAITDHIEVRPNLGGKGRFQLVKGNDDHNLPYETAKPYAEKANLLLIRGAEITKRVMPPGHLNVLFANDINPIAAEVNDWRNMVEAAGEQGAFIFWNHPGWEKPGKGGLEIGEPLRFTPEHDAIWKKGLLHGIEIFNGNYFPIVSKWCNERDLAVFSNSDIHQSEFEMYGHQSPVRPITLVLAEQRSTDSIKEAFFDKRTIAWANNYLFGRDPWLTALFKAAVEIHEVNPGSLELINRSSLPCLVRAGGILRLLPKDEPRQIDRPASMKSLTVENWIVDMGKMLQVPFE